MEGKTVEELVRLVNLKTKNGWKLIGGVVYAPTNFCPMDSTYYPFCQSVFKLEKKKLKSNKNGQNI